MRRAVRVPFVDIAGQFQKLRSSILRAVTRTLTGGQYIHGAEVERFEKRFADYCGVGHAVGVSNGTDALFLAFKVLGIGPGDEVITVPNSFIATVSSIVHAGARPVLVDVGPDMNINPAKVEKAITRKTKAIVPVHLAGKCVDMKDVLSIARRRGIAVIEDAAQSVGSSHQGRRTGSFGTMGCFSLHPLKNLNAAGDAGIITTSNAAFAEKLRRLRNHGLAGRDTVVEWGWNHRLDSIQAAVLNCRFDRLNAVISKRRRLARLYTKFLSGVVNCPVEAPKEFHTYHLYVIQCDRRDALKLHLERHGIETKVHYPIPVHLQPVGLQLGYRNGDFPECERLTRRILSLPIHQGLAERQVEYASRAILRFYGVKEC